jgi:hypothetical protein
MQLGASTPRYRILRWFRDECCTAYHREASDATVRCVRDDGIAFGSIGKKLSACYTRGPENPFRNPTPRRAGSINVEIRAPPQLPAAFLPQLLHISEFSHENVQWAFHQLRTPTILIRPLHITNTGPSSLVPHSEVRCSFSCIREFIAGFHRCLFSVL